MKMVRAQKGFTLIELVIVVVILGILAAVAIPRYINIVSDARRAAVNGMAGGLRSAVMLARAAYMVQGDNTLGTVNMDGTIVDVMVGSGVPLGTQPGIVSAITDTAGFTVTPAGGDVTFEPTNGGGPTCGVLYTGPTTSITPAVVTTTLTGC